MGIGVGIFLIAVGAILTFAVHAVTDVANIQTIGVILMIVGALGLVIDLIIFAPRRRGVETAAPVARERVTTYET
ncbi:MAG: hypothetical protein JO246_02575 [Frankiaceae bacterium]|nr:hypothetical protein [Frankiaceae bacterium]MBV9871895.1 hypothetical protein [Frankiaceae bacterium]